LLSFLADPYQELWRQMTDKHGKNGMLQDMVERIQGGIRSLKSKQKVCSSGIDCYEMNDYNPKPVAQFDSSGSCRIGT
jgi:hypothetical protein